MAPLLAYVSALRCSNERLLASVAEREIRLEDSLTRFLFSFVADGHAIKYASLYVVIRVGYLCRQEKQRGSKAE